MTIVLFCLGVQLKVSSEMSKSAEGAPAAVGPGATGQRRILPSKGDQSSTEANIRFVETKDVDMSTMNYTDFIRPFENNLNKISIIFNDGGRREMIEEEMYLSNKRGIDKSTIRTIAKDDLKGDWSGNIDDYAKFLRYELSTVYQKKNKNSTKDFKKVHRFDSLKDIYQPEGEDSYSVFPRIDITDHIYLMGDYFGDDYASMKAYT